MKKKLLYNVGPVIVLLLLAVAFWVLHHQLKEYHYQDIARSLREIPGPRLLLAFSLTVLSYLVLTGYDVLALRYIQRPLPFGKIALASFIGHVFSYNIGLSILGGSAVRYRLYSAWGLSAVEITKVVAFCTLAFWLGVLMIGGAALLLEPPAVLSSLPFPFASARGLGVLLLILVGGYLIWSAVQRTPLKIREWEFALPSPPQSLCQIGLSTLDWALVGAVCYVLLPPSPHLPYPEFLGIYLLAQVIGLISHVPGGIGVFETMILLLLSPTLPVSSVVGSLIAYRALYYLLPMGLATTLLAAHEVIRKRDGVWFALSGDAPRFLRATVGAIGVAVAFAMVRWLRPAPPEPAPPSAADLQRVRAIIAASRRTYANLALLGDKALLFSDNRRTFIMYGVEGRSWVALGDPVGPPEESAELVWRFRELCDRHGGWTVFYQVQPHNLSLYIDLGLTLLQLGEEARVPLTTLSLDDRAHTWRRAARRLEGAGCVFEVVPCTAVPSLLPELQRVSDAWLMGKNTQEKGFSLGFFEVHYLQHFPIGIVRQEGKIVAFANIWPGAEKEELSVDLMRYLPEAPYGVMDYLCLQLMLWGRQEGYQWFSLGMTPLSGPEGRILAPLWNRLGSLVFHHGEHVPNFQGRQSKEPCHLQWEPRYLASPGGLALPHILTDIAALISRGLKGVIAP